MGDYRALTRLAHLKCIQIQRATPSSNGSRRTALKGSMRWQAGSLRLDRGGVLLLLRPRRVTKQPSLAPFFHPKSPRVAMRAPYLLFSSCQICFRKEGILNLTGSIVRCDSNYYQIPYRYYDAPAFAEPFSPRDYGDNYRQPPHPD